MPTNDNFLKWQQLQKLGVIIPEDKIEGYLFHCDTDDAYRSKLEIDNYYCEHPENFAQRNGFDKVIPVCSTDTLGDMLPNELRRRRKPYVNSYYNFYLTITKTKKQWEVRYLRKGGMFWLGAPFKSKSLTSALLDMIIWLKENGYGEKK